MNVIRNFFASICACCGKSLAEDDQPNENNNAVGTSDSIETIGSLDRVEGKWVNGEKYSEKESQRENVKWLDINEEYKMRKSTDDKMMSFLRKRVNRKSKRYNDSSSI